MLRPATPKQITPAYRALLDLCESQYLTPKELAHRWRWSEQHLANLRKAGKGPAYVKLGGSVRYPMSEALAYELRGLSGHITLDRVALACATLRGFTAEQVASIQSQLESALRKVVA